MYWDQQFHKARCARDKTVFFLRRAAREILRSIQYVITKARCARDQARDKIVFFLRRAAREMYWDQRFHKAAAREMIEMSIFPKVRCARDRHRIFLYGVRYYDKHWGQDIQHFLRRAWRYSYCTREIVEISFYFIRRAAPCAREMRWFTVLGWWCHIFSWGALRARCDGSRLKMSIIFHIWICEARCAREQIAYRIIKITDKWTYLRDNSID